MGVSAFGMPLDPDDEVIGRIELDSLNYTIVRGDRADEQIVTGNAHRLVMAGIDVGR